MIRHFVIVIATCMTFAQFLGNAKAASLIERPEKLEIFGTIGKDSFQRSFEITAKTKITNLSLSSSDVQAKIILDCLGGVSESN